MKPAIVVLDTIQNHKEVSMFCPISVAVIPEFTMVFGGPIPVIALLAMLFISVSALAYGVLRGRNTITRCTYSHDCESDVEGLLSCC